MLEVNNEAIKGKELFSQQNFSSVIPCNTADAVVFANVAGMKSGGSSFSLLWMFEVLFPE